MGWDACPMALAPDAEHWRKNLSLPYLFGLEE